MEKETGKRLAGGTAKNRAPKKQKKEKRPGRLTRQQKLLIALAVVLAVALIGVLAWRSLFVRPELPNKTPDTETSEPQEEEIDWGEGLRPHSGGERKSEDYYTVLILGRDTGGGGNTDTMLLASYDVTNQKATVMSIPRDTMVNIPYDVKKINGVYNYGGGGDKGIQALYKEISQLVGFEPDFQVVVDWEAVGEIVDAMGGVWFDVPRKMDYEDPYQDLSIHLDKGYQLLNGEQAMGVVRFRDGANGYKTGDLGRIETQQAFLKAMVEQLLKIENVTKINRFIEVFQKNVTTDLSFENILWFAKAAIVGGLKVEDVNFVTMPHRNVDAWSRSYHQDLDYVVPVASELLDLVNMSLSPYQEVFTRSDLDIMSVNSDGSVSSSTGYVEDSKATYPKSHWQVQETPAVDENGASVVTDPETGEPVTGGETTDPGTGETVDSGDWPLDPETGEPLPPELVDPGTGETEAPDMTNPGAAAPETPDTQPSGGETQQPGDPGTGGGETAPAPDEGFVIVS